MNKGLLHIYYIYHGLPLRARSPILQHARKQVCTNLCTHTTHTNTPHTHTPGEVVDADSMSGFRLFGIHLDAELLVHQEDECDRSSVRLHVQETRVLHHQPTGGRKTTQVIHIH